VLEASAKDKETGKQQSIRIESRLDDEKLKKMQEDAEKFKQADEKYQQFLIVKVSLIQAISMGRKTLEDKYQSRAEYKNYSESLDRAQELIDLDDAEKHEEMQECAKDLQEKHAAFIKIKDSENSNDDNVHDVSTDEQETSGNSTGGK
jgi:molecular chaperone DnaK (HSP70)